MSDDSRLHFVDSAADFGEGERRIVSLPHGDVAVIHTDKGYRALSNRCPHQDGPVGEGLVSKSLRLCPGGTGVSDLGVDPDRPVVSCPWHGWQFFLEDGRHVSDPQYRIPTFDVVVRDGDVFVVG
ncbi:Rieske 2Fe-2S domain-containing protein [Haloferax sp. MBLA0076]|uniref:Rieske 2Fe-2S domain-containing protein n=1 Tax=Haloferax litoreum TaxID=2666140 RepID=A0A6A8GK73_9EURY|nr:MULTISPECIES: Rieske 2Fe-2S domain-containing protein [Haloferax]KAB1190431.1 Rieske 2Fe-2S domain-containing protein [Haloferax sp. CBA1148]MRX23406.1 Rieske 2Fe-2S domain-containing protein [Haloferax litoreum]